MKREFIGYGGYRSTLNEVKNKNVINLVFMQGKETSNTPQESIEVLDTDPRNYVFFGPPGTGKTYQIVERALELIDKRTYEELKVDGREALQQEFSRLTKEGKIHLVTFHQSYGYEDFIEGLKSDGKGNFVPTDGILKKAALEAMYEGIQSTSQDFSNEVRFEKLYDYLVEMV
ncbi:hypothetical protein [Bacillus cereus]|uniref:hypothetical protein n=1 Tax=Bacillus cereus TaxID=1396 RepID=UPI003C12FA91